MTKQIEDVAPYDHAATVDAMVLAFRRHGELCRWPSLSALLLTCGAREWGNRAAQARTLLKKARGEA